MISRPTLLVLGAGASMPYQFPSGRELRRRLIYELASNPKYLAVLAPLGFDSSNVIEFCKDFERSELISIDTFLAIPEKFAKFAVIGKCAIACLLIEYEQPGHLLEPIEAGHWYRYLWNKMERHWDTFEKNQLRIVTFNYDRSLEHYLARAMSTTCERPYSDCLNKLKHFRIKHVYGQLGELGELLDNSTNTRPFDPILNSQTVAIAANGLRVMHEREEDDKMLSDIREDVQWAERICFLGFSYDSINVSRLAPDLIASRHALETTTPRVFGTTKGLIGREVDDAMKRLDVRPPFDQLERMGTRWPVFVDRDNEIYLREAGVFDT